MYKVDKDNTDNKDNTNNIDNTDNIDKDKVKRCSCCNEYKSLDEFYPHKSYKHGKYCYCKACASAKGREYRRNMPLAKKLEIRARDKARLANDPDWPARNKKAVDKYMQKNRHKHNRRRVQPVMRKLRQVVNTKKILDNGRPNPRFDDYILTKRAKKIIERHIELMGYLL